MLDYIEKEILSTTIPVRKSATYVLRKYRPKCEFTCESHQDWGFTFATKFIINIYFNNKQKLAKDSVRKDTVNGFKKGKRSKI